MITPHKLVYSREQKQGATLVTENTEGREQNTLSSVVSVAGLVLCAIFSGFAGYTHKEHAGVKILHFEPA